MHNGTIWQQVVRVCGVRYTFNVTRLRGEFTQEQAKVYREAFKAVANKVIGEHDLIIQSGSELDTLRTIYREAETQHIVAQLQLSSIRNVPETLLIMMAETIVTGFGLLVDTSVNMLDMVALGITNGPELMGRLVSASTVDYWNGDAAAATAAFDTFVADAKASNAFDDKL